MKSVFGYTNCNMQHKELQSEHSHLNAEARMTKFLPFQFGQSVTLCCQLHCQHYQYHKRLKERGVVIIPFPLCDRLTHKKSRTHIYCIGFFVNPPAAASSGETPLKVNFTVYRSQHRPSDTKIRQQDYCGYCAATQYIELKFLFRLIIVSDLEQ